MKKKQKCPCGARFTYSECCGRYIDEGILPATPLVLMKSRYTAYTQSNIDYIAQTQCAPANQDFDAVGAKQWAQSVEWVSLKILKATRPKHGRGQVEFVASFRQDGLIAQMQECSLFEEIDGRWFYASAI